jgi:hypothetical protein
MVCVFTLQKCRHTSGAFTIDSSTPNYIAHILHIIIIYLEQSSEKKLIIFQGLLDWGDTNIKRE